MIRCIEIALTIPDNEALTALATLRRLGVAADALVRADLYRCDVADDRANDLPQTLRGFETIFNPNKHVMRAREGDSPLAGEVWIDEIVRASAPDSGAVRISGRALESVRSLERFTAWRLFAAPGVPVTPAVLDAATDALLCNPAFQKATR
jgi:hypothetical protein